jgi:hypothetical protein
MLSCQPTPVLKECMSIVNLAGYVYAERATSLSLVCCLMAQRIYAQAFKEDAGSKDQQIHIVNNAFTAFLTMHRSHIEALHYDQVIPDIWRAKVGLLSMLKLAQSHVFCGDTPQSSLYSKLKVNFVRATLVLGEEAA